MHILIHIYICMCIYKYMYVYIYVCMYVCMCVCMCIFNLSYTHKLTCMWLCAFVYVYYIYIHMCKEICVCTRVYTFWIWQVAQLAGDMKRITELQRGSSLTTLDMTWWHQWKSHSFQASKTSPWSTKITIMSKSHDK